MDDVIYLDTDEEITNVIDKIQKIGAERVSLVVPREATILQSVVNLKLIKNEAESLGKKIALVTSDKIAHNLAGQIGLEVYENLKDSRPVAVFNRSEPTTNEVIELDFSETDKKEKLPAGIKVSHFQGDTEVTKQPAFNKEKIAKNDFPREPRLKEPGKVFISKKALIITLASIVLVAAAAFVFIPHTVLTLTVKGEQFKKDVDITVDKDASTPNPDKSVVPGMLVTAEITASKTFTATGSKNEGENAHGTVTIKNYWDANSKSFPAGTKLIDKSGKVFATAKDVTAPGASPVLSQGQTSIQPGTVDVEITAQSPGEDYNVDPGRFTISSVSSTMTAKLFAESTQKFTGGITKTITIVSQDDIDKATASYLDEIKPSLSSELQKSAGSKKIVEQVIEISASEATADKKVGDEADQFNLQLKAKGQTVAFDEEAFMTVVIAVAQKLTGPGKKLLLDQTKTSIGTAKMDGAKLLVTISIDGREVANFDESALKKQIAGKKGQKAQSILKQNDQITDVALQMSPSWWLNLMPVMPSNIKFEYKYDTNATPGN